MSDFEGLMRGKVECYKNMEDIFEVDKIYNPLTTLYHIVSQWYMSN